MNSTKLATLALWITLPCLIGFGSLVLKNTVQELEGQLNSINRGIQDDIKTIHVLKAEWSHLNTPSRLRQLVAKHISLNPVQAEQIINYSHMKTANRENSPPERIFQSTLSKIRS